LKRRIINFVLTRLKKTNGSKQERDIKNRRKLKKRRAYTKDVILYTLFLKIECLP